MSDVGWLLVAFLAVWAGIGAYLLALGARQRRLEERLERLDGVDRDRARARDAATH